MRRFAQLISGRVNLTRSVSCTVCHDGTPESIAMLRLPAINAAKRIPNATSIRTVLLNFCLHHCLLVHLSNCEDRLSPSGSYARQRRLRLLNRFPTVNLPTSISQNPSFPANFCGRVWMAINRVRPDSAEMVVTSEGKGSRDVAKVIPRFNGMK